VLCPGVLLELSLWVSSRRWIKIFLYCLTMLSAVFSMYRTIREVKLKQKDDAIEVGDTVVEEAESVLDHSTLKGRMKRAIIGLLVGMGSALTGTSGPVILLPILLSLKWETMDALGSAQVVQFPLALSAVIGFLVQGSGHGIHWGLGGCLAAGLVPGVLAGATIAHTLPVTRLRLAVALILVLASLFLLVKLVYSEVMV